MALAVRLGGGQDDRGCLSPSFFNICNSTREKLGYVSCVL